MRLFTQPRPPSSTGQCIAIGGLFKAVAGTDPATEQIQRQEQHAKHHVLQYMVLGVLFLPLYLLCGGVSAGNRFEQAADRYALTGRGWWPWLRE